LSASWEGQTTKIAGFGSASGSESVSIGQRYGSADPDPDPPQNVMNPHNADPDPGSGAFLTPGSWIRDLEQVFPDPGSRIPNPYF